MTARKELSDPRMASTKSVRVRWTAEMEDCLIDLWQDHECLYNVSCKDYHNRYEKDKRWRQIASTLNIPGEIFQVITQRWYPGQQHSFSCDIACIHCTSAFYNKNKRGGIICLLYVIIYLAPPTQNTNGSSTIVRNVRCYATHNHFLLLATLSAYCRYFVSSVKRLCSGVL